MTSPKSIRALAVLVSLLGLPQLFAQGTAFTYQGQLKDNGTPANAVYDLQLTIFDAVTNGNAIGSATNLDEVGITNGLFTVTFDPGTNVFTGNPRWLQLGVRPGVSVGAYTNLIPRQKITPAPMAIFAGTAATANLATAVTTNVTITNVTASGTFSGNGSGLTSLNGAAIQNSTISSNAIAPGQVVKNLNGLTDTVLLSSGNNIFLTTNANTITILTAPGLLSWIPVAGITQAAAVNKGYLVTNNSLVTVTLPAAPALADIVRVSGTGSNGWKLAQNASQLIRIRNLPGNIGVTWIARNPSLAWSAIASSEDGTKLVATVSGGQIYTSTNSGATWTARFNSLAWSGVASSADGNNLVAVVNGEKIYTSTNSGVSWSPHEVNRNWISVASSANGKILAAAVSGDLNYISSDFGFTWTPHSIAGGGKLACSADGLKMVVVVNGGQIYTSPDSGFTWTPRFGNAAWSGVASSTDGIKLVATVSNGQIYTSTDSGMTWTARDTTRAWTSVASSEDGNRLVATVSNGSLYTSTDSGVTWFARDSNRAWSAVASSYSGTKLAATVNSGQIYTSDNINPTTTTGTAGYLLGPPYSAVELQYTGNNEFIPLSHEGDISGF